MQWILQCAPELRPWLCCLYADMRRPLGTSYSVDPSEWSSLPAHLSDSLRFLSTPWGTDIPVCSTLLSARHKSLSCKADLRLVPISSSRIWMRVADPVFNPDASCPHLALRCCNFCSGGAAILGLGARSPCLPPALPFESAADAFGEGDACGVGGWLCLD